MICNFVCPVDNLIKFKEMPKGWKRRPTRLMDPKMLTKVKLARMGK